MSDLPAGERSGLNFNLWLAFEAYAMANEMLKVSTAAAQLSIDPTPEGPSVTSPEPSGTGDHDAP